MTVIVPETDWTSVVTAIGTVAVAGGRRGYRAVVECAVSGRRIVD